MIYDNLCYSCTKYAKVVNSLSRGKITIVGHYTNKGKNFKEIIFPQEYDGLEMSWFVDDKYAYGGRKGLVKLIKYMLFAKKQGGYTKNEFDLAQCTTDCKTVKGVLIRSCSILTSGKIIKISK